MKFVKGLLILAILLILKTGAIAEDGICFADGTSGQIVVELEKGRIMVEAYQMLEDSNVELQNQLRIHEDLLAAEQEKARVYEETIRTYDKAITSQRQACEQAIREARPSFFRQVINNFGFIGIGVLVGLLL